VAPPAGEGLRASGIRCRCRRIWDLGWPTCKRKKREGRGIVEKNIEVPGGVLRINLELKEYDMWVPRTRGKKDNALLKFPFLELGIPFMPNTLSSQLQLHPELAPAGVLEWSCSRQSWSHAKQALRIRRTSCPNSFAPFLFSLNYHLLSEQKPSCG